MKRLICRWMLLTAGCVLLLGAEGYTVLWANDGDFDRGVAAYRSGKYLEAEQILTPLHREHPENTHMTYYLAITQAQLGRYGIAKTLYQEILTLTPNSEAGTLAQKGLQYLPEEHDDRLDPPPQFQAPPINTAVPAIPGLPQGYETGYSTDPQAVMMQTMFSNGNGNGNNNQGMPWQMMMPYLMQNSPSAPGNHQQQMDPQAFSTMMMNQMLEKMDFSNSSDDNH